jgi:hypothetical protein
MMVMVVLLLLLLVVGVAVEVKNLHSRFCFLQLRIHEHFDVTYYHGLQSVTFLAGKSFTCLLYAYLFRQFLCNTHLILASL